MRGRAVFEGGQQLAKALRHLFGRVAQDGEHALLQLAGVDADAAARQLEAVGYQVVETTDHFGRVGFDVPLRAVLGHREGVVHRVPSLLAVVPLEQREVVYEGERYRVGVGEV